MTNLALLLEQMTSVSVSDEAGVNGVSLLQDNVRSQTTHIPLDMLRAMNPRAGSSPDVLPIEHVWVVVGAPQNIVDLEQQLVNV
ncbi:hypothetical protein TNCV_4046071 [Trichonephila clavipes]|nr:hypothetical protein TNCV_4046071 [Trichonephila clavipes]